MKLLGVVLAPQPNSLLSTELPLKHLINDPSCSSFCSVSGCEEKGRLLLGSLAGLQAKQHHFYFFFFFCQIIWFHLVSCDTFQDIFLTNTSTKSPKIYYQPPFLVSVHHSPHSLQHRMRNSAVQSVIRRCIIHTINETSRSGFSKVSTFNRADTSNTWLMIPVVSLSVLCQALRKK